MVWQTRTPLRRVTFEGWCACLPVVANPISQVGLKAEEASSSTIPADAHTVAPRKAPSGCRKWRFSVWKSKYGTAMLLLTMSQCIAHYVMHSCVCSSLLGTTFRPKLPSRLTAAKARAAGFYVVMESTPDAWPNSLAFQGYHAVICLIIQSLHLPKYAQ